MGNHHFGENLMTATATKPNTYFCNRIAPIEELNHVLSVSAAYHEFGIYYCVPQKIKKTDLNKMVIRWKSPTCSVFLQGEIMEIVDSASTEGIQYRNNLHARPWGDLDQHGNGSVIRVRRLQMVDVSDEIKALKHIQSCKYLHT